MVERRYTDGIAAFSSVGRRLCARIDGLALAVLRIRARKFETLSSYNRLEHVL